MNQLRHSIDCPLVTANLPGTGGRLRTVPSDFQVEEVPAYAPCGEGEHLFLWVEKCGVSGEQLLDHVAGRLEVPQRDIGCAGLKDRHAVTRQYLSVPRTCEPRVSSLDGNGVRLLSASAHANKLRTGHLRGNSFRITLRDVVPDALERAARISESIRAQGLPNFFGEQRFGRDGDTGQIGLELLRGAIRRVPGPRRRERFLRKLYLSAAQAALFNAYLARRMADGLLARVLEGDVMQKTSGGLFYVTDVEVEQARFNNRETVHAGPIFGKKTFAARGAALERELAVLDDFGVAPERFGAFGPLLQGTRRANLVYLDDLSVEASADGMELRFSLPAGSYATVLLREVMKSSVAEDESSRSGYA